MSHSVFQSFLEQFPGPYSFQAGSCGVDDTFDVFCETSGEFIIASHYWEEKQAAKDDATIITLALLIARQVQHADAIIHLSEEVKAIVAKFFAESPAPFAHRYHEHDFDPGFEVVSQSNGTIAAYVRPRHRSNRVSKMVAASISYALGNLAALLE